MLLWQNVRMSNTYSVRSVVVLWPGSTHSTGSGQVGAWHFAYIGKKQSEEIRKKQKGLRRGFGAVRVCARIGKTAWETSIFPDSRSGSYVLPLKASVRKAEGIVAGDRIILNIKITP